MGNLGSDLLASLRLISPPTQNSSEKFSFNLAAFLQKHQGQLHLFRIFFAPDEKLPEWLEAVTCPPRLYVGMLDDGFLYGSRLSQIICQGKKADSWAYPPREFPGGLVDVTDRLWSLYLQLGKCALDPQHTLYWEKDRYEDHEDTRRCRWCGRLEVRQVRPKVITQIDWKPAMALGMGQAALEVQP